MQMTQVSQIVTVYFVSGELFNDDCVSCLNLAIGRFRSIHTYTRTHMHAIQLEFDRICVLSECCICCERNEILLGGFTVLLWLNSFTNTIADSSTQKCTRRPASYLIICSHQGSSESGHRNFFVTPGLQQHVFPTIGRCRWLA